MALTLASDAITFTDSTTLSSGIIGTAQLSAGAVTADKLASNAITAEKMSGGLSGSAPVYGCRAWVNFDGTRNEAGNTNSDNTNRFIRASGNVSSVLKNSQGDYTVFFTIPMIDDNYVCMLTQGDGTSTPGNGIPWLLGFTLGGYAATVSIQASSVRVHSINYEAGRYDAIHNHVMIFR